MTDTIHRTRITRDVAQPVHPCHNIDGDSWEAGGSDVDVYTDLNPDPDAPGYLVSVETVVDCDCGCGQARPVIIRLTPSHAAALAARIVAAVEFTRPHNYCDHCDTTDQ